MHQTPIGLKLRKGIRKLTDKSLKEKFSKPTTGKDYFVKEKKDFLFLLICKNRFYSFYCLDITIKIKSRNDSLETTTLQNQKMLHPATININKFALMYIAND